MTKLKIVFLLLCIVFSGCALFPGTEAPIQRKYPDELDTVRYLIKEKEYKQAEAQTQSYLMQTNDIYWHGTALLLLGEIQEETRDYPGALETYKKLIEHGKGYDLSHQRQGLYRISWMYEILQNYDYLLTTLIDLQKARMPDDFIQYIETPARLANVYYVMGVWEKALEYRSAALNYWQKHPLRGEPTDSLLRPYFYLSFMQLTPGKDLDRHYSEVLHLAEKDLLYVMENASPEMSEKAAQDLLHVYRQYFTKIVGVPVPKNSVDKQEVNTQKLRGLADLMDAIEVLKAMHTPEAVKSESPSVKGFFIQLKEIEEKTRQVAHELEFGIEKEKKRVKKK
ncbi:MAG: hypothetical protein H6623_09480 [Bdellovibrionaceae bacterium]|nr:hypothetical protein [Pseudobdellovibrionaceae bacterium]